MNYEDVHPGLELAPLTKGPLGAVHLMRWSASMENWHRIHYDHLFAVQHDKLPGVLINGSLKQQFLVQLLRDWAEPDGWLWKIRFQFRAKNLVNETLQAWGRVTATSRCAEFGLVHLDIGLRNENGEESTPGAAVVALAYRGGPPVPYPFVAPAGAA
ncbi:acyl dehydratase [Verticiella sediminum]|uniref:Acyl dehydratase n=1 Tax=Verticiella sediminum TaxID=1247510 RepID=A0A556ATN6_9BURK|nr:acyl dehydratase [Verticiella sediminum]TSH96302.1 acyl dehydratase [Verticiella sediminum]